MINHLSEAYTSFQYIDLKGVQILHLQNNRLHTNYTPSVTRVNYSWKLFSSNEQRTYVS